MISIFCLMARFPDSSGVGNGPTKCADLAEANIVEQNDNNWAYPRAASGPSASPAWNRSRTCRSCLGIWILVEEASFGRIFGRGATGSYCRIGGHRAWPGRSRTGQASCCTNGNTPRLRARLNWITSVFIELVEGVRRRLWVRSRPIPFVQSGTAKCVPVTRI
jgi:hypothetical protein